MLLSGPPAAGKTMLARELLRRRPQAAYFASDKLKRDRCRRVLRAAKEAAALRECVRRNAEREAPIAEEAVRNLWGRFERPGTDEDPLRIDTARTAPAEAAERVLRALRRARRARPARARRGEKARSR